MGSTIISDSANDFYARYFNNTEVREAIFGPEIKKRDSKNSYHLHYSGEGTVHVSLEQEKLGKWKCFSKDEGGDWLEYVIEKDLLPDPKKTKNNGDWLVAIKALYRYAGVDWQPPQYKAPEKEKIKPKKQNLVTPEIKEDLNTSLFQALEKSPSHIEYLLSEGITLQDAHEMGIGLVTEEIAAKYRQLFSGKWTDKETGEEHTGHVRRIAFPVVQEASTFYTCRTIDPKEEVKYKNSKDAEKTGFCGETLVKNGNRLILVEGYKDALTLNNKEAKESNGRNKITYLGIGSCNLSEIQTQALIDLTDRVRPTSIILCLDNDDAGYQGTLKLLFQLLPIYSNRNQIELMTTTNWDEISKKEIVKDPFELVKKTGYGILEQHYAEVRSWELFLLGHIMRTRTDDQLTTKIVLRQIINCLMQCQPKDLEHFKSLVEQEKLSLILLPWECAIFSQVLEQENQKHLTQKHLQEVEQHHAKLKHAIECADLDAIAQLKKEYPSEPGIGKLPSSPSSKIDQRIKEKPDKLKTFLSDEIDRAIGWIPGAMHIVAGRPANCKTSLMLWCALKQLTETSDRKIVFFSFEETIESLFVKLLLQVYGNAYQGDYDDNSAKIEFYYDRWLCWNKHSIWYECFI